MSESSAREGTVDVSVASVAQPCPPMRPDSPRVISSETLLAGASQLAILHQQTVYFLRRTRLGKLILTK